LETEARALEQKWRKDPRWADIERPYTAMDVVKLRTSLKIEYSIAQAASKRLWEGLTTKPYMNTFGAMTGAQAVEMVKGGLECLYLSGWQVAADANLAGQTFPDQSLYPSNSVPTLVRRLNNGLMRADQIDRLNGITGNNWFVPIVADAEAGFGGSIHAFELMKNMIEAGAAGVHFEDQLASEKKCGHMGGKVLVPTSQFIRTLTAARLAADVCDVPTILCARTDALDATLLTSDVDDRDKPFIRGERTVEGFFQVTGGMDSIVERELAYCPYADLLWFESSSPDLHEAEEFANRIHKKFPNKMMAYNCSPSFNWKGKLNDQTIAIFQKELGRMGYKFQFITLAGWHLINYYTFDLARSYNKEGMTAYTRLQESEFAAEKNGYTATKHQAEAGAGYYDAIALTVSGGDSSTLALTGSTEVAQFR